MKCPYCSKKFDTWVSVRAHVSGCSKNTKEFYINPEYGPIHIGELNLPIRVLNQKYPNINMGAVRHSFLKKGILLPNIDRECSHQDILRFIRDFNADNGRIPQTRDFDSLKYYPSSKIVKKKFGSWNNAIELAGLEPNYNDGFGTRTVGLDGILYRSGSEALFSNIHLYKKHNYIYELKYPNHNKFYDFYLPDIDIYIEVDGGCRPEVTKEKIEINKQLNRILLVVQTDEIVTFKLPDKNSTA